MEVNQSIFLPPQRITFKYMTTLFEAMKVWLAIPADVFCQQIVFKKNMFDAFKSLVFYKFHLLSHEDCFFRLEVPDNLVKEQLNKSTIF